MTVEEPWISHCTLTVSRADEATSAHATAVTLRTTMAAASRIGERLRRRAGRAPRDVGVGRGVEALDSRERTTSRMRISFRRKRRSGGSGRTGGAGARARSSSSSRRSSIRFTLPSYASVRDVARFIPAPALGFPQREPEPFPCSREARTNRADRNAQRGGRLRVRELVPHAQDEQLLVGLGE